MRIQFLSEHNITESQFHLADRTKIYFIDILRQYALLGLLFQDPDKKKSWYIKGHGGFHRCKNIFRVRLLGA